MAARVAAMLRKNFMMQCELANIPYLCESVAELETGKAAERGGSPHQKYEIMTEHQNIIEIIEAHNPEQAVERLHKAVEGEPAAAPQLLKAVAAHPRSSAPLLVEAGKQLWKRGMRGEAMSAYEKADKIDPEGPARLLIEHSNSIMDFFNPDLLNP